MSNRNPSCSSVVKEMPDQDGGAEMGNASSSSDSNNTSVASRQEDNDCKTCNVTIKQNIKAMQCDMCDNWFCLKCTQLSNKQYSTMQKLDEECVMWFCIGCKTAIPGVKKVVRFMYDTTQWRSNADKYDGSFQP